MVIGVMVYLFYIWLIGLLHVLVDGLLHGWFLLHEWFMFTLCFFFITLVVIITFIVFITLWVIQMYSKQPINNNCLHTTCCTQTMFSFHPATIILLFEMLNSLRIFCTDLYELTQCTSLTFFKISKIMLNSLTYVTLSAVCSRHRFGCRGLILCDLILRKLRSKYI